jgi:hypothetical protein
LEEGVESFFAQEEAVHDLSDTEKHLLVKRLCKFVWGARPKRPFQELKFLTPGTKRKRREDAPSTTESGGEEEVDDDLV